MDQFGPAKALPGLWYKAYDQFGPLSKAGFRPYFLSMDLHVFQNLNLTSKFEPNCNYNENFSSLSFKGEAVGVAQISAYANCGGT
jgi:hypothetical protein